MRPQAYVIPVPVLQLAREGLCWFGSFLALRLDVFAYRLVRDIPRCGTEVTVCPKAWQFAEFWKLFAEHIATAPLDGFHDLMRGH